jgi:hypothetical protein
MKHSPIYGELVKNKKEFTVNRAKKLEGNISNGRKIFRLGLWLYEIPTIGDLVKDKKMNPLLRLTKIVSTFCSFIYYFMDNWIWLAKIGYTNVVKFGYNTYSLKNLFSFLKTILETFNSGFTVYLKKWEEQIIREKLMEYADKKIEPGREYYVLMVNLILLRRETRFNLLEFFIYVARFLLLTKALKLFGHESLHPIFVSFCGLFQSWATVFKTLKGKSSFTMLKFAEPKETPKTEDKRSGD